MKLIAKIIITGQIETLTGLHIGGSKTSKKIGEVDNPVIKAADGIPYIPGSSLKGKLRSMLAKKEGSIAISQSEKDKSILELFTALLPKLNQNQQDKFKKLKTLDEKLVLFKEGLTKEEFDSIEKRINEIAKMTSDDQIPYMHAIFGYSGNNEERGMVSRLLVRDAKLNKELFEKKFKKENLDSDYSQTKFENTIDRLRGTANNMRQIERIPAGAIFDFELIYDVYQDLKEDVHLKQIQTAMKVLMDDYIGGNGSRGYGKIQFLNVKGKKFEFVNDVYQACESQVYTDFLTYSFQ